MVRDNHESSERWGVMSQLLHELIAELPTLAARVTDSIRESLPVYLALPKDEHRSAVAAQLRHGLTALAEQRTLNDQELQTATDLAAARAANGVPIDAVIAAYQAGDQEIWRLISEQCTPEIASLLPRLGSLVFESTGRKITAMAEAHSRVARAIDGGRITLTHQLMSFFDTRTDRAVASLVAKRLGFEPSGRFAGLVWAPSGALSAEMIHDAVAALHLGSLGAVGRVVPEGRLEVIAQVDAGTTDAFLRQLVPQSAAGRWGLGLPRDGLDGAADSLADARIVLRAATDQEPVVSFQEDWLEAVILAEGPRFAGLLRGAVDIARDQPHLSDAVVAFAVADMSIAATAAAVHLHANSVTYRLDRWKQLTGLDPRSFSGLARSVIACRLARSAQVPLRTEW